MTLDGAYEIEEQAHVLTRIPGRSENDDGSPDVVEQYDRSANPYVVDEWFHGDATEGWENDLQDARSTKYLTEYDDSLLNYRLDTAIEIGITTDGDTVTDSDVSMTDPDHPDTTPGGTSYVTLEGDPEEPKNMFRNEFDHYDDPYGQKHPANIAGRYVAENHNFRVDGVDGVRASIIFGANDPYILKLREDVFSLFGYVDIDVAIEISRYIVQVPAFYAFIDFALMADGTKVVTVWDASRFPAHALYVAGTWQDENLFRKGIEWVEIGFNHSAFIEFGLDSYRPGVTPFDQGGHFLYEEPYFRDGAGKHPVMHFRDRGSVLTGQESEFEEVMFPVFN